MPQTVHLLQILKIRKNKFIYSLILISLFGTGVEKTICVDVFPKCWSFPINISNSCVLGNATLINIEKLPVTQLHSRTFGQLCING